MTHTTPLAGPWLSLSVLVPLLVAAGVARLRDRDRARRVGLQAMVPALVLALLAARGATLTGGVVDFAVDPLRGSLVGAPRPLLGVDGLSGPLLPYLVLLTTLLLLAAPRRNLSPRTVAGHLAGLAAGIALFTALDLGILAVAWWLSLVAAGWHLEPGSEGVLGARAIRRYLALSLAPVLGLVAWCLRQAAGTGGAPLHLPDLLRAGSSPTGDGLGLALVLAAVMLRKGVFPVHSWLPVAFERLSPSAASYMVGLHAGAYLLLRLGLPFAQGSGATLLQVLVHLGGITAVYGALLALSQRRPRRTLGFLAMSQSALMLIGIESSSLRGVSGSLLHWLSVGLSFAALALAYECAEARLGAIDLRRPRGLVHEAPTLAGLFLFLGLATVGLPGTLGFASEDLLVHGVLESLPWVGVSLLLATALNGVTVLRLFAGIFLGPPSSPGVEDLRLRERAALVAAAALLLLGGLAPSPLIDLRLPMVEVLCHPGSHGPRPHQAPGPVPGDPRPPP